MIAVVFTPLFQSGVKTIDIAAVAGAKPLLPGQIVGSNSDRISLRPRHLLNLRQAEELLILVGAATGAHCCPALESASRTVCPNRRLWATDKPLVTCLECALVGAISHAIGLESVRPPK